jgi:spermidine synthase
VPELPNAYPRPVGLRPQPAAVRLGFLASSWQIILLREFSAQFYGSELSFGFVLAFWLLWGGLGSRARDGRRRWCAGAEDCLLAALFTAPLGFALLRLSGPALGLLPGEVTGFGPILLFAAAASGPMNFLLGAAFARAAASGSPADAYFWESAGAVAGAALAYGIFLPYLSTGAALAAVGIIGAAASRPGGGKARRVLILAAAAGWSLLPAFFDAPSQALRWRPFELALTKDGLYGRIQVVRAAEQVTVYENGLKSFTAADKAGSEEAAGFALLQRPQTGRVLLLGNGIAGLAAEVLRYHPAAVEIVEIDPAFVRSVQPFLSAEDKAALADPRVRLTIADGREYLGRKGGPFDVIIVGLPDPTTAQINRFYTAEFFRLARDRLGPAGLLTFRATAAENYLGSISARYLGTHEATLKTAFPRVEIVPGAMAVFLASRGPLTLDPDRMAEELQRRGAATASFNRESLRARLHPLRRERLRAALDAAGTMVNSDDRPISYFYHALLWSAQKRGPVASLLDRLSAVCPAALLSAAVLPLLLMMAVSLARSRRRPGIPPAYPFIALGVTALAAEILLLVRYQTLFGGLYGRMALLLGLFMAGTAAGARLAARRKAAVSYGLFASPGFAVLLLGLSALGVDKALGSVLFACLFPLWGGWGGFFFTALSRACPPAPGYAGRGYAADLLGAFAGSLVLAAILLPLVGLDRLFAGLAFANLTLLPALAVDPRIRSHSPGAAGGNTR